MTSLRNLLARIPRELRLFAAASLAIGISYSLVDSVFNNFINARFALTGFQRSFLEMPRELPGVLVVFITAALGFLSSRRLGAVALLLGLLGALLMGLFPSSYSVLVLWLFIYSMGQHLFMPIASTIGMELAKAGQEGQRLGQLNALRNFATIIGSFIIFVGFKYLNFSFPVAFVLAAVGLFLAATALFAMKPEQNRAPKTFLTLHREYRLYYLLAVLFGMRKQLFITFAPWVIVSVFKQPTQTLATLMTVGGVIGILFQPILGRAIDRLGERFVLAMEAALLVVVCFGNGFAKSLFPESVALLVVCGCYLLDQVLMSVNMARTTFMKKIALQDTDVQPALTASITLDHVFSIGVALLGGVIWNAFGFQYVFLMGVLIAAVNFFAALRINLPKGVSVVAGGAPAISKGGD